MQPEQAAGTLREMEALRHRTRSSLGTIWAMCVVFGIAMMGGAIVDHYFGGMASTGFWAVLGPVGGTLAASHYRRQERRLGVETRVGPYLTTAIAMIVGTVGAVALGTALGSPTLAAVGALVVVAAGYLVFARLSHSRVLGWTSIGLVAAVLAMWALGLGSSQIVFAGNLLFGAALLVAGLLSRPRRVAA